MTNAPTKYSDMLVTYSFFCALEVLGMCHMPHRERLRALWDDEQQYKAEQQ